MSSTRPTSAPCASISPTLRRSGRRLPRSSPRPRQVAHANVDGVLVQPMIAGGVETMMGIMQDPLFGPLVAFGLGGIHVEILKDVLVRIAPLTDRDVDELLHGIKGFPLLQGYRGHPAADLDALRDLLCCASRGWPTRFLKSRSSISIR